MHYNIINFISIPTTLKNNLLRRLIDYRYAIDYDFNNYILVLNIVLRKYRLHNIVISDIDKVRNFFVKKRNPIRRDDCMQ